MPPISNKQRGKYFEEKITSYYRKIFELSNLQCFRSGSSGARISIELTGDITFTDPKAYPIITECKYRKDINLTDFFPICNSEIDTWIEQSDRQYELFVTNIKEIKPLKVLIVGKPYLSIPWVVILNDIDDINLTCSKVFQSNYLIFSSKKYDKRFLLTTLDNLIEIFFTWNLMKE